MRRLGVGSLLPAGAAWMRCTATAPPPKEPTGGQPLPDPMIFNVPTMCPRTVGREHDVLQLWQNLLTGRRCQVISGVDGIGKSTIAAAFCDCAKRSQRFSCVQWFNAAHSLTEQLNAFMASMRGRKEQDVLLVLDDVADPLEVSKLLPKHNHCFVLMTTSKEHITPCTSFHVVRPEALNEKSAEELISPINSEPSDLLPLFAALGFVPLLMDLAMRCAESHVCSCTEMHDALRASGCFNDGSLSVSIALKSLLSLQLDFLEKAFPGAKAALSALSCFHTGSIATVTLAQLFDGEGGELVTRCVELGILASKWESDNLAMHTTVARTLRTLSEKPDVAPVAAARVLLQQWPRRWSGMGADAAMMLVWHTNAILAVFQESQVPLSIEMLGCLDRAATFCAHQEGRELNMAARMWLAMLDHLLATNGSDTAEFARISRESGRLLHFLRHPRAAEVLARAYKAAVGVYGASSGEAGLVLACYAPHLDDTPANELLLLEGETALQNVIQSTDEVLSKEELLMTRQSLCVLMLRRVQLMGALNRDAVQVDAVWEQLNALRSLLTVTPPANKGRK